MSNKSEIKAAMESLQVRKPLRLPSRAPVFAPPTVTLVENSTQVGNPARVTDSTQVEKSTEVEKVTSVPKKAEVGNATLVGDTSQVYESTMVSIQTEVLELTRVDSPTEVRNQTPVENRNQVEKGTPVGNKTQVANSTPAWNETPAGEARDFVPGRRTTEQDSSVVLEAQAEGKLERGYTRVPNAILMRLVGGEFTRNEIKLALLIARFTISYQRKKAPLSKAVLERQTGLRGAAVLEALSGLVAKGLVEKEKGDQHRPNLLGLILPEGWDAPSKPPASTLVENLPQVSEPTKAVNPTPSGVGKSTGAGVGNPTYLKDNERYLNINSLSTLPEKLREYFAELRPSKKRESEWQAFQNLNAEYSADDVVDCLVIVQSRGISVNRDGAESVERCHSPMAFLSKAIGGVLEEVYAKRATARERSEREQREAQEQRQRKESEAREVGEWVVKERAFRKAFPGDDRQCEVLTELCRGMPFRADGEAGRTFAIGKWWESLSRREREEFSM